MKSRRHSHPKGIRPSPAGTFCKGRIWLDRDGSTFLGTGRVILLERIREHGSIAKAARSMEMSYKHAWDLVDSINRQAVTPLVITSKGGKGGGGTRLTPEGEEAVTAFRKLQKRFQKYLQQETEKLLQEF